MNPFDLKSVLLAKHAQHVALVHFPIALIFVSAAFDLLSLRKENLALLRAAYYTVIAAAIAAVPTVATGILAWQLQFEGKTPRGNLKLHMFLAFFSSVLIWLVCGLHVHEHRKPESGSPNLRLAIEFLAVALTLLTAHVGGFVSGVNGPA
ncbi:MAG TPA: DUF2231 domain-containing protein [Candidatus Acidoferrales bacterium]|jgi:uncharacterized membrane protein|nr:DUF2231 domain-containing protein [Candidatus Acidoferrales bacterium]